MTKIKTFGRPECRTVSEAAKMALEKVAADFGLTLQTKGGKFTSSTFVPNFTFLTMTDGGVPAEFLQNAPMYGLKSEDFGKTFKNGGKNYRVTGINPKKRRCPIMTEDDGGKTWLFPAEGIAAQFRMQDTTKAAA